MFLCEGADAAGETGGTLPWGGRETLLTQNITTVNERACGLAKKQVLRSGGGRGGGVGRRDRRGKAHGHTKVKGDVGAGKKGRIQSGWETPEEKGHLMYYPASSPRVPRAGGGKKGELPI